MKDIKLSAPDLRGMEREKVNALFDDPLFLFKTDELKAFASEMCAYTGFKHAYPVASGTAAVHLALIIADIGPGDHVWCSSMTFMGGISPVKLVGATPVFVDLDPGSWVIDCDLLADELEKADKNGLLPKAIVTTDLYGQTCDMDRLVELANRYDLTIISDSAEGLGAFCRGAHSGKGAKIAILSFNNNKIITTSGGGMLLSDEEWIVKKAEKLANQARENALHYQHEEIGYNYRMSQIEAAIGREQLKTLKEKIDRRRAIFDRYVQAFGDLEGITMMPEPEWSRSTRWLSCMAIDRGQKSATRDAVIQTCQESGVETRPVWKPMHMQPVFEGTRFLGGGFCEHLFKTGICLPSGSGMSDDDQNHVIQAVRQVLDN